VFIDGREYRSKVKTQVMGASKLRFIDLEDNVGKGWYGHRVYAACSFLVNADIILYLDEDNWIEPTHVQSIVETFKGGYDWVYSLRKIYSKEGEFLCEDNCESLGKWEIFMSRKSPHGKHYLIDTSAYLFNRKFIQHTCHLWHSGAWGEDRRYFYAVKDHAKYDTSGKYTLCYRLDGNPNSVTEEFFKAGNKTQHDYYEGKFPWVKT